MTVRRGSPLGWRLTLLVLAAACALPIAGAACTTGVTPVCDDAGSCLIAQPPDGSVVGDGAPMETGPDVAPESGPESGPEGGVDVAPEAGQDAEGGSDAGAG